MTSPSLAPDEFARFGPWIDVIESAEQIPRLFRDHPIDLDAAELVVKVPRNIPRRDATPDMDLYDHLIAVEEDGLTVLSRDGHDADPRRDPAPPRGVSRRRIVHADVVAIEDSVNLLQGRYRIRTRDGGAIALRYSGSARASIGLLTGALRARFAARDAAHGAPAGRALAGAGAGAAADLSLLEPAGDLALGADLRDVIAAHPGVAAWAAHGRGRVSPRGGGWAGTMRAVAHALSPAVVQGCVIAGDAGALEVLGRHERISRGNAPVHSASRMTVALAGLDQVELEPHPLYPGAETVTLRAGAWAGQVVVPAGSETRALLAAAL